MSAPKKIIRLLTAAAAVVLTAGVATPASAGEPQAGSYYDPPKSYDDHGTYDPECAGLDLTAHWRQRGVASNRNVRGTDGQAFFASNDYRFREVWVDDATGDVVITDQGAYSYEEVAARRVSKASVPQDLIPPEGLVGPIYVFRSIEKGGDVVRDGRGKALYRTRGTVVSRELFDTLGDSQPGGYSLSFEPVKVRGPHPLLDVDLCDVAAAQLHPGSAVARSSSARPGALRGPALTSARLAHH
jgi:hypothetical protein